MSEIEIHPIQAEIIVSLLLKPQATFSELTDGELTNDHISFHVRRLVSTKLIQKEDGKYTLTIKGKEFANRFDEINKKVIKQAKNSVVMVLTKEEKGKKLFLMQQRLKQPYYGYWGGVGGKIGWGETVFEAASRELKEETNLTAKLELVCVEHKLDLDENDIVLEDKFLYFLKGTKPKGNLMEKFIGGKSAWLTKDEIFDGREIFSDIRDIITFVSEYDGKNLKFVEKRFKEKRY